MIEQHKLALRERRDFQRFGSEASRRQHRTYYSKAKSILFWDKTAPGAVYRLLTKANITKLQQNDCPELIMQSGKSL
jgi:hypothetical protein